MHNTQFPITPSLTNRRTFTRQAASLLLVAGISPGMLVSRADAGPFLRLLTLTKFTPARLFAGLALDLALSVVIELTADYLKEQVIAGDGLWRGRSSLRSRKIAQLENERDFTVNSYKASVVTLGAGGV